jgi:hypothetical protein
MKAKKHSMPKYRFDYIYRKFKWKLGMLRFFLSTCFVAVGFVFLIIAGHIDHDNKDLIEKATDGEFKI